MGHLVPWLIFSEKIRNRQPVKRGNGGLGLISHLILIRILSFWYQNLTFAIILITISDKMIMIFNFDGPFGG